VEPDGTPLQYVKPPFVTTVHHLPPWRYPINRLMGLRARRRFRSLALPKGWMDTSRVGECRVRRIPYIHPEALAFSRKNPRFRFRVQSVFERTPGCCHVLRTMNIFNRHYFPRTSWWKARGRRSTVFTRAVSGLWGGVWKKISAIMRRSLPGVKRAGKCWSVSAKDRKWKTLRFTLRWRMSGTVTTSSILSPVSFLLICDSYPPVMGGSEIEAQRVCSAMIQRGHRALVLCAGGPPCLPSVTGLILPEFRCES